MVSIVTLNTNGQISKENITLNYSVKKDIEIFLDTFEEYGDKENTEVIAYAYKLSKIIGDYQKTLHYYDMYKSANLESFIRICKDINKIEHIKEFEEKFRDWESLSVEQKDILIDILLLNLSIRKSFGGIYRKLEKKYQDRLSLVIKL